MIYPFLDFAVFRKLYHGSYFIPNSYPCFGKYILQFTVEFLDHRGITKGNRTKMYYAHAYSSWERGSNEVSNRLIRRFYKKGYNIDKISKRKVKELEDWINNYPRKILGWKSANQFLKDKQIF